MNFLPRENENSRVKTYSIKKEFVGLYAFVRSREQWVYSSSKTPPLRLANDYRPIKWLIGS